MADRRMKEVLRLPRLESIGLAGGEISGGLAWKAVAARLEEASDALDDASPENIAALRREAERLIAAHDGAIDAVCARLTRGRAAP